MCNKTNGAALDILNQCNKYVCVTKNNNEYETISKWRSWNVQNIYWHTYWEDIRHNIYLDRHGKLLNSCYYCCRIALVTTVNFFPIYLYISMHIHNLLLHSDRSFWLAVFFMWNVPNVECVCVYVIYSVIFIRVSTISSCAFVFMVVVDWVDRFWSS